MLTVHYIKLALLIEHPPRTLPQVTVPIGKERSSGRSRAPERVPGGTLGAKNRRVCRGVNQGQGTGRGTNKVQVLSHQSPQQTVEIIFVYNFSSSLMFFQSIQ